MNLNYDKNYFFLNNVKIYFDAKSYSLIQYCEFNGISIPRFCFHPNLSIAGNCRICVVEVSGLSKLIISCAGEVSTNLKILTNTTLVRIARESILEFLLLNHPLDCPICDQGGECDLQDQTIIYGGDRGRFKFIKRSVVDKSFSPFIKTVMTRCIHCTRCIRYFTEVAGVKTLGIIGRGGLAEIDTYINTFISSEVTGNVIDLCPVGALTTKPSAYRARSWEFYSLETIDILDSVCSSIRIDLRGNEIYRILPKYLNTVTSNWITDKVRFSYDSYRQQRFVLPLYRTKKYLLSKCSWESIYKYIKVLFMQNTCSIFSISTIYFFSGIFSDTYSNLLFRYIALYLGIPNVNTTRNSFSDFRNSYLLNKSISTVEYSTFFFFWGLDIQIESPIINIKIQKAMYTNTSVFTFFIGTATKFNYSTTHLGFAIDNLFRFFYGKSYICFSFLNSISPTFFVGSSTPPYSVLNLYTFSILGDQLSFPVSYNYISLFASDISIYELGLLSSTNMLLFDSIELIPSIIYLLGTVKRSDLLNTFNLHESQTRPFIIYQGSHLDEDTGLYSILLPNCTHLETSTKRFFLNCEGTSKISNQIQTVNRSYLSSDSVLYTLFKYLNNRVNTLWLDISYLKQMHILYIPAISVPNLITIGSFLSQLLTLRNFKIYIRSMQFIVEVRSYYKLDLISRISSNISKYTVLSRRLSNFH